MLWEAAITSVGITDFRSEFQLFFESEYERLVRTLFLTCGNRDEAEDLAQEAMARAFEHWERVRRAESPIAYVLRIGFNLHRRRTRRAALLRHFVGAWPSEVDPAAQAEHRVRIVDALRRLPPSQREAIVLVDWYGLSPEEAGSLLRIRASSVRARLHRARRRVQENLRGDND